MVGNNRRGFYLHLGALNHQALNLESAHWRVMAYQSLVNQSYFPGVGEVGSSITYIPCKANKMLRPSPRLSENCDNVMKCLNCLLCVPITNKTALTIPAKLAR